MKKHTALTLLGISLFIWGTGEGMFMPFTTLYLDELGANMLKIGSILGAFGLATTLTHIPAGFLSDRFGARPLLRWSWGLGLVATLLMAFAPGLTFFVLGLLLYGITAGVSAPLSAYVTAARGRWSLARTLTTVSASFNAGYIIGPRLGGLIGDWLGLHMLYRIAPVLFFISALLVWTLPDIREAPASSEEHIRPASLWGNGRYWGFIGLVFILMLGMYLPQPLTPNFLRDVHALSYSDIGLMGTVGGLGNVALSLLLGMLSSWQAAYLLAQAGVMIFALSIWRGATLPIFMLGYFMLGGYRAGRSLTTAKIRDLVQAQQIGLAYAIAESVSGLSVVLAPILAGAVYDQRPEMMYMGALALLLLSLLGTFYFGNKEMGYAADRIVDVGTG